MITSILRSLLFSLTLIAFIASCSKPKVIKDLKGESYQLVNSDSARVNFPTDYKGDVVAVTFIYTHCPDICPLITSNLSNIQDKLQDTSGIDFVEISFDPRRDTPSVLKKYKKLYGLNDQFSLLTGDTTNINKLMNRLDIVTQVTYPDSTDTTSNNYFFTHTNRLYLMDRQGRMRYQYPASAVQPQTVVSDLNTIR